MTPSRLRILRLVLGLLPALAVALVGCKPAAAPPAASSAEKPHVEGDLSRTTLSDQQAESLGVRTEPAKQRDVQDQLRLTGWVMAPPGREVTLTAPVAGIIREVKAGAAPFAGMPIDTNNRTLLQLQPTFTPLEEVQYEKLRLDLLSDHVRAEKGVAQARAEVEHIKEQVARGVKSEQDLDLKKARINLERAEAELAYADQKLERFNWWRTGNSERQLRDIVSPLAGTVLAVHVAPGQYVSAAAPLVTVADLSELWLRVPVPEHDLPRLARDQPATLLFDGGPGPSATALPQAAVVCGVPQVDLARHTADILYKLPANLPPGIGVKDRMLTVLVPLGAKKKEIVVPYAAVVFDAYGGSWVYVEVGKKDGKRVYERRRVELGAAAGNSVVLRAPSNDKGGTGPLKEDEIVVVEGAASLFSREFYKPPQ
jgi:cobalt-zinc-cadmium efflux system membrane fusion protein